MFRTSAVPAQLCTEYPSIFIRNVSHLRGVDFVAIDKVTPLKQLTIRIDFGTNSVQDSAVIGGTHR